VVAIAAGAAVFFYRPAATPAPPAPPVAQAIPVAPEPPTVVKPAPTKPKAAEKKKLARAEKPLPQPVPKVEPRREPPPASPVARADPAPAPAATAPAAPAAPAAVATPARRGKVVSLDRNWGFLVVESPDPGAVKVGDRLYANLADGRKVPVVVRRISGNLVSAVPEGQKISDDMLGASVTLR